jgi:ferredoxin
LFHAFQEAKDPETLAQQLLLRGRYFLKDQVDSSHKFLYGHRYWPEVKKAIEAVAASFRASDSSQLSDQILKLARELAKKLKVDEGLLVGITAVGFMTTQQAGLAAVKNAKGQMLLDTKQARKSPDHVLRDRAKDNSQGWLGFLRTIDKKWTITYDEADENARYKMNNDQDMAWGAADDRTRNWREIDPRRPEGPIPVECRSASCGTCWVGVLGGAEQLSDVAVREGKKIKEFGYIDTTEPKPLIRLACQAKAGGAISIVIPPWNAVFGKYLRSLKQTSQEG